MNISFADFWDGFQDNNNFFIDLLKTINSNFNLVPFSNETEILIYSCFGHTHHHANRSKVKKIFYTGENLRPNFNECDYSLTFDFDSYDGRNIRLPLWMLQIDWFNKKGYKNPQYVIPLNDIRKNPLMDKPKQQFCSIVFNGRSPHRWEIIEKLSKYKNVHCYGKPFGNWFYGEDVKLNIISNYKFNICFENSISPGYHTEKMIHAKTAGCLPLYWADNNCEKDYNKDSFLNLYNFNNLDEFVEKIIHLDTDDSAYNVITSEYLFKDKEPSLDFIKNQLIKIL
jgi:hypothetical protein